MASQDELLRLWRINRTCWEMLKDRGYNVPAARLELTLEDFKKEHGEGDAVRDNMTIVVAKTNDPQDQVRALAAASPPAYTWAHACRCL